MSLGGAVHSEPVRFHPQDAGGWKPGLALAVFCHLLLVGALALGVRWKIQEPPAVEAEVWTEVPRVQEPIKPVPEPQPAEVTPLPKPVEPDRPAAESQEERPADIQVTPVKPKPKPKVEKEVKKHPKKEPKEVFLPDPPKKVPPKPEVKPEKPIPPKPLIDPKAAAKAKAAEEAQAKREAEKLAAQRRANLDRLMRNLAQDQAAAAGMSDSYKGRLVARIRPNIVFAQEGSTNFKVLVRVECTKDGKITRSTIMASSGNPRYDEAVIRALERTQVLPMNENKIVPCPFEFVFNSLDF